VTEQPLRQRRRRRATDNESLGVNFINILRTNFSYERRFGSFSYVHVTREKLPKQCSFEKFVCKMLMKLTIGVHSRVAFYTHTHTLTHTHTHAHSLFGLLLDGMCLLNFGIFGFEFL